MTINSEVRVAGPFQGNDIAVDFPFNFKVFGADEVLVVREEAGVERVLELSVDYTVALNADQEAAPGGAVALLAGPLPSGETLTLTSALAPLQPVDLTNQGGFYPRVINGSLDRLTILIQQLSERLSRTLVAPISDGGAGFGDLPGVGVRKGSVLAFDEVTGAPLVGPQIGAVGTVAANTSAINAVASSIGDVNTVAGNLVDVTNFADVYYGPSAVDPTTRRDGSALQNGDLYFNTGEGAMRVYDGTRWTAVASGSIGSTTFSGDGVTVDFVLASSPGAKNNTQVYISGVYQQKSEYALTGVGGTTITFTSPPPAGTNNIEVITLAPLPVDPLTAEDITDLIELRGTAVRKTGNAGAAIIPGGTTAQRPGAPTNGMFRYNAEDARFEGYQDGEWKPIAGDGIPMFDTTWCADRSSIPAGYVAADGQLLSRATYPDAAAALVAGKMPQVADATWLADPLQRGKYTLGDGSTTFRLPDYNGKFAGSLGAVFLRGDGAGSAGSSGLMQRDALQNLTGSTRALALSSGGGGSDFGVFSGNANSGTAGWTPGGSGGAVQVVFNASSSPGARTADETRPLNVTGCWIIKLFGAVTEAGSANAAQLASDYANLVSRIDALEGMPLTKEYVSAELAITNGGLLTIAHGLASVPKLVECSLICKTADAGYSVGDVIVAGTTDYGGAGINSGYTARKDATNISLRIGSTGIAAVNNSTGSVVNLTSANWRILVRALA